MNLPGLSNGPPSRPSGNEGKPPVPGPAGRTHAFGDVVSGRLTQPLIQGDAGGAGAGVILPTDQSSGQFPAKTVETAREPAADLDHGLNPGAQPAFAAEEIADLAPESGLPGENSVLPPEAPPDAPADSIPGRGDVRPLNEMPTAIRIPLVVGAPIRPGAEQRPTMVVSPEPAAVGQPAPLPTSPASPAQGGESSTILNPRGATAAPAPPGQGSPATNPQATSPLPRDLGEAAVGDPGNAAIKSALTSTAAPAPIQTAPTGAATPASPDATSIPDESPAAAPASKPNSKSLNMAGADQTRAGERPPVRENILPDLNARTGERRARPSPQAAPSPEAPPSGDRVAKQVAIPAPNLPELPTAAARGSGSRVHDAIMQAHGASEQVGLAASAAATAQSPAGPTQSLSPVLQANSGGAGIARAVAPQIAVAIGSGPGSGRIELRLDPPELGTVQISLEITDQSLRATVMADRPETNALLRRHGDVLLTQLQQAGFTGIDLQFAGNRTGNQGSARHGDAPRPVFTGELNAVSMGETVDVPASRAVQRTSDRLDLRF